MKKVPKPTDSELEILQILWTNGPSTVRLVNEKLNEKREVGYTTTLKLMQIMTDKGIVCRDTSSRTHIYRPVFEQEMTQRTLLQSFVERTFQGSAMNLIMQALGNHKASKEELEEIKKFINQIEKNK